MTIVSSKRNHSLEKWGRVSKLLANLSDSAVRVPWRNAATSHANSFNALRVGAALWVLFSHAYALLGLPEPATFVGHPNVEVDIFFTISGYLVIQSWESDPDIFRFFVKRSLRIFPGLLVCLVFTALVVGLLATTLAPTDYLRMLDP